MNYLLFIIGINSQTLKKLDPKTGSILISEPFMLDPNFKRTVILLCDHQDDGSFGLILNRPMTNTLNEIIPDLGEAPFPLYYGGPVATDTLHYIHTGEVELEEIMPIKTGLVYGGDFEIVKELLVQKRLKQESIRFFIGYTGWSGGQLKEEISENSWIVGETDPDKVFSSNENTMWTKSLESLGGSYGLMAKFPENPNLN